MSATKNTHRRASADDEEPQTPDTRQSGVNTEASRPSTGRRLSANVPAFVPTTTPTSSRLAGAPYPAMPRIRELTAYEAAAEARAWYAQEDHAEGAHEATAGTRHFGTQYDSGSLQAHMGPPMHPTYHGPYQPLYPVSQLNAGPYAAYAAAQASAGHGNFPLSTPEQQMRTGPRGMTPSTSVQEAHASVSYRASAPRTLANFSEGSDFPVNAQRAYQAVQEHAPSPFPSQHTVGIPPSVIAPGGLPSSNFAQWASSNDQRRAPAQYAVSGPAVHPSAPAPGSVSSRSPVRRTYPPEVQRALAHVAAGRAVHPSTLALGHVSSQSPVRHTYPPDVQRTLAQYAAAGQAVRPPTRAPRNVPESNVRRTYSPRMQRDLAQYAEAEKFLHPSTLGPGNIYGSYGRRTYSPEMPRDLAQYAEAEKFLHYPTLGPRSIYGSYGGRTYSPEIQRDISEYPPLESYVRSSALALGGFPATPYEQWASSTREQSAPVQHPESGSAISTSTLAPGYIPASAPVQQAYPTDQQRASTLHAVPAVTFHPSLIPPRSSRSSNSAPQAHPTGYQGANPTVPGCSSNVAVASSSVTTRSSNSASQAHSTGYQGAGPAVPHRSSNVVAASSPGTTRSSKSAAQAHSTGYQGASPAVPRSSSNVAAAPYAEYTNVPRPAPPAYPGHEQFTRTDVETFIRRAQDEEWLRTARHDEMLAQQHASNRESQASRASRASEVARSELSTTATEQSGTIITEAAQRALEERRANRIRRERVQERERAARGIPDPQEAADRAQFQRLVETYNYLNYSATPVNPRLPNAHIVASDPANQELVSVIETVMGNLALYRRGYATFPGSLHTQTEGSSTGQSPTGRRSSRPDRGRITDSIPDWNDPAVRDNPEIRRDFLNNSTFVSFMGPVGEGGSRRMSRENSDLPSSDSNTISSSEDTSATPVDTPSQSESTPTESGPDEGRAPQLPVATDPVPEEENTPRPCAPAVPVSEEEKTPRPSAAVTLGPEKEKTPQRPAPVVPAPQQERTPQRPVSVVAPTFEEEISPRPPPLAAPVPQQETIRTPPGFEALVSKPEDTSSLLAPANRPESKVPGRIASFDVEISSGVTISSTANVPIRSAIPSPITYANIAAGRVRISRPSAIGDPQARGTPAMHTFYRGSGNAYGAQDLTLQGLSNISDEPDDGVALTPTRAAKRRGRRMAARLASSAFRDLNIPQMPTLQPTDSAFGQYDTAEGVAVAPSQTEYQAQYTPAEGTPTPGLAGPTTRKRRGKSAYKKRRQEMRKERRAAAAALQEDHDSPHDEEEEDLPTEAQ